MTQAIATEWEILDTGMASPQENMDLDAQLLQRMEEEQRPILHFYGWNALSATYGHFIDPLTLLNPEGVKRRGLQLAKRPTGGGIVFHVCDFAFSVLVPADHPGCSLNTLENYAFVNRRVIEAIRAYTGERGELLPEEAVPMDASSRHFCMAKPTRFDVMIGGRKVGGAAQRRKRWGYLHQGTISLAFPPKDFLQEVLRPETKVFEAMTANTFSLLGDDWTPEQLVQAREDIRRHLIVSCSEL